MRERVMKGLLLALIFGGAGYLMFRDTSIAFLLAVVMFMSMFVKKNK